MIRPFFALLTGLLVFFARGNGRPGNNVVPSSLLSARAYYLAADGDDAGSGERDHPWKTIGRLKRIHWHAGDGVYFKGAQTFAGSLVLDSTVAGKPRQPIVIGSYGEQHAIIQSGNVTAMSLDGCRYIIIRGLDCQGAGRKDGNTQNGIMISHCRNIQADSLVISGYQKTGLLIHSSSEIRITRIYAHDNGAAGIAAEGINGKKDCRHLYIGHCRTENNPGDPTNLVNHSGNGIVVGNCSRVTIEYCTATNNGWDMPRIGNGPVGLWAYEADSVIIQHCLSYRNKTSAGGADGGGFDLDGGVTHSIVQYCLSYENQGAGYCIFQYLYASPWHDNVFRNNISENDGLVSDARAGVHIWNSSRDAGQFSNCLFYNNTVYNAKGEALSYSELSKRKGFRFYNNIFVGRDSLVKGEGGGLDIFRNNDWRSLSPDRNTAAEMQARRIVGLNIDPGFTDPGHTKVISADELAGYNGYRLPENSVLRKKGIGAGYWSRRRRGPGQSTK
jgi:hypothetical protein